MARRLDRQAHAIPDLRSFGPRPTRAYRRPLMVAAPGDEWRGAGIPCDLHGRQDRREAVPCLGKSLSAECSSFTGFLVGRKFHGQRRSVRVDKQSGRFVHRPSTFVRVNFVFRPMIGSVIIRQFSWTVILFAGMSAKAGDTSYSSGTILCRSLLLLEVCLAVAQGGMKYGSHHFCPGLR